MGKYRTPRMPLGMALFILALWLIAAGGWVANVVKIFWTAGEPITAFFVIRCVGVFAAPLGVVLGFL